MFFQKEQQRYTRLINTICYMTEENPVSWLAHLFFINLYVYLETGLNRSKS